MTVGGYYAITGCKKRTPPVAADKFNFAWLNSNFAIRHENCWISIGQWAQCHVPAWCLTFIQNKFMQSAESCRKAHSELWSSAFTKKGSYLLHLPLLLLNNLIQQGLEAVLWEERDKQDLFESTCWASLNCDGFKCVSAWAARVTISSLTERPLGMPVRDSWPFPCDCDNNDWRWGSDGPKTPGNESSKWQR